MKYAARLCLLGMVVIIPSAAGAASLSSDMAESNAGFYRLSWEADTAVRLVESRQVDFSSSRTVYSGADTARVFSGKPNGEWHYRLESAVTGQAVSPAVSVAVRHHSLPKAAGFFTVGATVFLATVGLIVIGSRSAPA